jgi:hypothetical protein
MNVIGIYSGTFQPPHRGNYAAYEFLKKLTGPNTFVATTDQIDLPNSPLNFQDKQQIWTRHGVPIDKIVKVKDPTKALEVTKRFGPDRTVAIFGMTKEDSTKYLQNPSGYFQPFKGMATATSPISKHAYIFLIPDNVVFVNKSIYPITVRQAFASKKLDIEKKKSFFKQLFGWYDISLFDLIAKKFAEANSVKERINEDVSMVFRRFLTPIVKEVLGQLSQPQGTDTDTIGSLLGQEPESAAQQAIDKRKQRVALDQKTKEADAEVKNKESQKKYFQQSLDKLKRFDIPQANNTLKNLKAGKI